MTGFELHLETNSKQNTPFFLSPLSLLLLLLLFPHKSPSVQFQAEWCVFRKFVVFVVIVIHQGRMCFYLLPLSQLECRYSSKYFRASSHSLCVRRYETENDESLPIFHIYIHKKGALLNH